MVFKRKKKEETVKTFVDGIERQDIKQELGVPAPQEEQQPPTLRLPIAFGIKIDEQGLISIVPIKEETQFKVVSQ